MAVFKIGTFTLDGDKALATLREISKAMTAATKSTDTFAKSVANLERNLGTIARQSRPFNSELSAAARAAELAQRKTEDLFKSLYRLGAGFRQTGQAVFSFAAVLSIIAVPQVHRALEALIGLTAEYQDNLVRAAKTADLFITKQEELDATGKAVGRNLEDLDKGIRQLAKTIALPIEEMAKMAAIAGQLGADTSDKILGLVSVASMLAVTTDISGENAVTWLGKLEAAYASLGETGSDWMLKLANTVNKLENETAANTQQIVEGMLEAASSAVQIGIAAPDLAAMISMLVSMGLSSQEAGVAVRRLSDQIVQFHEKVAKLIGVAPQEIFEKLEQSGGAVDIIISIAKALDNVGTRAEAMSILMDIFEIRGQKAQARFNQNFEMFVGLLEKARVEWEHGNSMIREYEKSMESLAVQWDLFKNNVKVVALEFGDSLVPILSKFISFATVGVQQFGEFLKTVDTRTKLAVVAFAALFVALAPIVTILGSLVFALGLFFTGLTNAAYAVGIIGSSFGPVLLIGGALLYMFRDKIPDAIAYLVEKLNTLAEDFDRLAADAIRWGSNVIAAFAEGMARAVNTYVIPVINFIIGVISDFLEGHSPPKKGPLKNIMKWGSAVMSAYLKGFTLADFGVLRDITNTIRGVLESKIATGDIDQIEAGTMLARFREQISKGISEFNRTGIMPQDLFDSLSKELGEAGKELSKLIQYQLQYNKLQRELDAIESRRKEVISGYEAEARAIEGNSSLTVQQKAVLLAQLRTRRRAELENLDRQHQAKQAEADRMKASLDFQKAFIEAMQDQDSVLKDILDTIERLRSAAERASKETTKKDRLQELEKELALNKELQKQYAAAGLDTLPLLREELRIRKAIAEEKADRGMDISKDLQDIAKLQELIDQIEESRKKLSSKKDPLADIPTLGEGFEEASAAIGELGTSWEAVMEHISSFSGNLDTARQAWTAFRYALDGTVLSIGELAQIFGVSAKSIDPWVVKFFLAGQKIRKTVDIILTAYEDFKNGIEAIQGAIDKAFKEFDKSAGKGTSEGQAMNELGVSLDGVRQKIQQFWEALKSGKADAASFFALIAGITSVITLFTLRTGTASGFIINLAQKNYFLAAALQFLVGRFKGLLVVMNRFGKFKTDIVKNLAIAFGAWGGRILMAGKAFAGLLFRIPAAGVAFMVLMRIISAMINPLSLATQWFTFLPVAMTLFGTASALAGSLLSRFVVWVATLASILSPRLGGVIIGLARYFDFLISAWTHGTARLRDVLEYLFQDIAKLLKRIPKIGPFISGAFVAATQGIVKWGISLRAALADILGSKLWGKLFKHLQTAFTKFILPIARILLGPFMAIAVKMGGMGAMIAGPFIAGIAVIGVLIGMIRYFATNIEQVKAAIGEFGKNLLLSLGIGREEGGKMVLTFDKLQQTFDRLKPYLIMILGFFFALGQFLGAFITGALPSLGSALGNFLNGVIEVVVLIIQSFGGLIEIVAAFFQSLNEGNFSGFWQTWHKVWGDIGVTLDNLANSFIDTVAKLVDAILDGIVNGIKSFGLEIDPNSLFGKIFSFLESAANGGGENFIKALGNGIKSGVETLYGIVAGIVTTITGFFGAPPPVEGVSPVEGLIQSLGNIDITKLPGGFIDSIFTAMAAGVKTYGRKFLDALKNFVFDGVSGLLGALGVNPKIAPGMASLMASIIGGLGGAFLTGLQKTLAAMPSIIQFLSDVWANVLGPALTAVGLFIIDKLLPALWRLLVWLGENLPPVIATLANFWSSTLYPAIVTVRNFVSTRLIPALSGLWDWLGNTLVSAITYFGYLWDNYLAPILSIVWSLIRDIGLPILMILAGIIGGVLFLAVKGLIYYWQTRLQPMLELAWWFISTKLIPIVKTLVEMALAWLLRKLVELQGEWTLLKYWIAYIRNYINAYLIPKIRELIGRVVEIITKIGEWQKSIQDIRDEIINNLMLAIEDLIDGIGGIWAKIAEVKDKIFRFWDDLGDRISGAIRALKQFLGMQNRAESSNPTGGNGGGSGGFGGEPGAARGGILFHRPGQMQGFLIRVAEKEDEIIMPLSEVSNFTKAILGTAENTQKVAPSVQVNVNVHGPVIRKEEDIRKLAAEIRRELVLSMR